MSKAPTPPPSQPGQGPLDRLTQLEDEVRALQLALSVALGEQRLNREDGKEWLAELQRVALSGLSKQRAKQASRVAREIERFFGNIEKGISTLIRRKTTH